ncbi:MAG TPA: M20/M25/M40 family metallo-hydrolase [Planctomycetaceae bacterium]|nr:M20/M25/M40 family metallo-hydrolase [Planctomycetaceae bacterium]
MRRALMLTLLAVLCLLTHGPPAVAFENPQGLRHRADTGGVPDRRGVELITADTLRKHVTALASDTFEGREAGTRGGRAAGAYLIDHLRRRGFTPGGPGGDYEQPFGRGYRNILVRWPGRDPHRRDEYVVVGAHYDHVGYGRADNSNGPIGYIHNGADDNASGTAGLLAAIDAFAALDEPPARSVLFAFWDGEEQGLLGSEHWVENPTVPLDDVRLFVNADMIGRLRDETVEVSGLRTGAGLRQFVCEQNSTIGLRLTFDWSIRRDSDHYPFYRKRIPFVMLHTGKHSDYHRPSDDVERLNLPGAERVARLLFRVVQAAAAAEDLPVFRDEVSREDAGLKQRLEAGLAEPPSRPLRLGISWRRDAGEPGSVILSRIVGGSPAARAGLRVGDRVYAVNGRRFQSSDQFRELVRAGEELDLTFERQGRIGRATLTFD